VYVAAVHTGSGPVELAGRLEFGKQDADSWSRLRPAAGGPGVGDQRVAEAPWALKKAQSISSAARSAMA
jgi:hypothetical protein